MVGAANHPRDPGIGTVLLRLVLFAVPLFALMVALQLGTVARTLHTPIVVAFAVCAVMILAYRGVVRLIERRPATELALDASSASAAPAALLGIGIYALTGAIVWLAGVTTYAGFGSVGVLQAAGATALIPAVTEEIVFRGAIFRIVEEGFGTLVAVILSAVLFGAIHFTHDTIVGVGEVVVSGVLLGLAFVATRTLWVPIGIHFGWDFVGGLYGISMSGHKADGLLNFRVSDVAIGNYELDRSVIEIAFYLIAAALFGWVAVRRGRWRSLRGRHVQPI